MSRLKRLDQRAWKNLKPSTYRDQWYDQVKREYKIIAPAVRRQMQTAKEILKRFTGGQKGLLLADDVGLGKTAVAAIVGHIFACKGRRVVVLAPNELVADKWRKDLETHKRILNQVAPQLHITNSKKIQVRTHYKASKGMRGCDLLIVDEAHRSKGEDSRFRIAMRKQQEKTGHILCLTATPFSIDPSEFGDLLKLIGVKGDIVEAAEAYSQQSKQYWSDSAERPAKDLAKDLVEAQMVIVKKLKRFIVRHCIGDLQLGEVKFYGKAGDSEPWSITHCSPETLEILLRADRLFDLDKQKQADGARHVTNDPRVHVSWDHLRKTLHDRKDGNPDEESRQHEHALRHFLRSKQLNPKAIEVAKQIRDLVGESGGLDYREKVLVFCHHYASAGEIAKGVKREFGQPPCSLDKELWRKAWSEIIDKDGKSSKAKSFVSWLSSANVRTQTAAWLDAVPTGQEELVRSLCKTRARKHGEPIADAAKALFQKIKKTNFEGLCERVFCQDEGPVNDNMLAIFNSPFGPDVLVATDKLSEGIDLHHCCRHLVHYELSPSPMRIIQRRGRLRRIGNWASRCDKPLEVRYPYLPGTRDQRLVEIMKGRLELFDSMLGGVGSEINVDSSSEMEKDLSDSLKREQKNNRVSQMWTVVKKGTA